jgi:hypothetical protein
MSELEAVKRRIKEIISKFKACRRLRGIQCCTECENWRGGELTTCPLREEDRELWDLLFSHGEIFSAPLDWLKEEKPE